ncbi:MAG: exo-alpha-sialidase [Bacteroides sp.]|nr:exo-alpha-sialidase [Bacteroides sp.]
MKKWKQIFAIALVAVLVMGCKKAETKLLPPNTTIEIAKPYRYSSWPMCGSVKNKLVCVYTIGDSHHDNYNSDTYVSVSSDGINWSEKKCIINTPNKRDGVTGKGNDKDGNMLILDRIGAPGSFDAYFVVYKSADGLDWQPISQPEFETRVGHAGDIVYIPTVGLVSFFNTYGEDRPWGESRSWGMLRSEDNGVTWTQQNVETGLSSYECPSELSAVYLGDGRILVMGRLDNQDAEHTTMYQMQSSDYGATWVRHRTNIAGLQNTPSLLYDEKTRIVTMYIMDRGTGELKKYVVTEDAVWDKPTSWPAAEIISSGWGKGIDVGNVNTVRFKGNDFAAFYSGTSDLAGIYAVVQ